MSLQLSFTPTIMLLGCEQRFLFPSLACVMFYIYLCNQISIHNAHAAQYSLYVLLDIEISEGALVHVLHARALIIVFLLAPAKMK